ncbi:hypothetical protein RG963_01565 [Methanosarcina sp. Z-7115]|uniref:Secreted protein n=1 Tax=Methanosarcina baikalica TaxID=3073890 RepID=A0ABU2CXN0_9EURY|nr:hypothetical protein [Methanosarcina sp. Z-7115]MDR7664491.1 hypothetical protein [Methanosarcina sp. Z-7115]
MESIPLFTGFIINVLCDLAVHGACTLIYFHAPHDHAAFFRREGTFQQPSNLPMQSLCFSCQSAAFSKFAVSDY